MSKLIQLRQRIKAIETIKKITHAMRLIAMSSHSQLKNSQPAIASYTDELESIFNQLRQHAPKWQHSILQPDTKTSHKIALIVVGSQKGLCGSFNNHLFKAVHKTVARFKEQEIDIIPVGQKAIDLSAQLSAGQIKHSYKKFSAKLVFNIADEIAHTIFYSSPAYKEVFLVSNRFKNFFIQYPKATQLIPEQSSSSENDEQENDLLWEQSAEQSLNELAFNYITARIQLLLFDSLLSEHAARFISMDGATRNANGILETTKLEYNKLRQAKITKELTELTSSH